MATSNAFELDPKTVRDFNALLEEMQETTGADMRKVVRNAGRDVTRNAIRFTPIAPTTFRGRRIRGRGFAKAGWFKGLIELGVTPRAQYHRAGGRKALEFSEVVDKIQGETPRVEIANQVPYIEEVPGAILQLAVARTSIQMAQRLSRMARRMGQRWR